MSFFQHKQHIQTYKTDIDNLKTNIYDDLVSLINELTTGISSGLLYPTGKNNYLTLDASKYITSEITYDKLNDSYAIHINNCLYPLEIIKLPVEDILQLYKRIYQADSVTLFPVGT